MTAKRRNSDIRSDSLNGQSMSGHNGFEELVGRIPSSCCLNIHTCYHVKVPRHWEISDRINADYHILLVLGGQGHYLVGEEETAVRIPFEKHKLIFISRGMLHNAEQNHEDPPVIIPVRFGLYDCRTQLPVEEMFASAEPFSFSFVPKQRFLFQQLFLRLHDTYLNESAYRDQLCGAILSEILFRCAEELKSANTAYQWDARIEKMKRTIDEHPEVHYTPAEMAELAQLSEKYCRKLFIRQYGMTPVAYQTKARLEYASFMLSDSNQSVKEVALTLGYPDPYTFSKQFKKQMGHSPGIPRQETRQGRRKGEVVSHE